MRARRFPGSDTVFALPGGNEDNDLFVRAEDGSRRRQEPSSSVDDGRGRVRMIWTSPAQMERYGDPVWTPSRSTGHATVLPMDDAEKEAAAQRKANRPPFGFARALVEAEPA